MCGSDFSESSRQAAQVAAALAERLVLVHAVERAARPNVSKQSPELVMQSVCERLCEDQKPLNALHRAPVQAVVRIGRAADVLLDEAKAQNAHLITLGAAWQRANRLWKGANTAEDVAESAEVPTLIVRQAAPFLQWLQGTRPLRAFVGVDFSGPSESALLGAEWLRSAGPCEIFAGFLETDGATATGEETVPSLFMNEMVLKTAHNLERLFESKVRRRLGMAHVHTRFERSSGNSAGQLVQLAIRDEADVIVLGTHSRNGWHRIGHHSVSRFVLRHAPVSVLVCPGTLAAQAALAH